MHHGSPRCRFHDKTNSQKMRHLHVNSLLNDVEKLKQTATLAPMFPLANVLCTSPLVMVQIIV
jgi:hypothetical protein